MHRKIYPNLAILKAFYPYVLSITSYDLLLTLSSLSSSSFPLFSGDL